MELETSKKKLDRLDIQIKQKKFFKIIYGRLIGEGGSLKEGQYIRVYQNTTTNNVDTENKGQLNIVKFFNNIDDLVSYCGSKMYNKNTYFTLSTTNGQRGREEDLISRSVLGFDFDKKDSSSLTYKEVLERFKKLGLWYHVLIDSGHGYHVYICIQPTRELRKVQEVQKILCEKLNSDANAIKSTQVLRIPYSFNIKNDRKMVKIMKMFDRSTIKRYSIDKLYNRYCNNTKDKYEEDRAIKYTINNTNIPYCINEILTNGSPEGKRYEDLQRIVVTLRQRNKTIAEIKQVCKEWAYKSNYKDNLDYRIDNIYNNLKYVSMDCKNCKNKVECFNKIESDFNFNPGEVLLSMSETHTKYLKVSNRKGVKVMKSNDLLIYCILKNHNDGLHKDEIIKELTYKDKCRLSDKTLRGTLKSLENNGFIESDTSNRKKIYKLKDIRSKIELTYNISFAATYECIKGAISTEELRLYNYMRYLHNKQQREDLKVLRGNLFQFRQVDLAKDLGVTQGRISTMINNLLEEKIISIWYRKPSKNNGFDYYIYRLNY